LEISATTKGLMGEFYAAGAITSFGTHKVSLCQQDSVDLVAFNADQFLRVQVKTATLHKRPHHNPSYQFQLGSGGKKKRIPAIADYDIIALVAGFHRRVLFLPVQSVSQQLTKRLPPSRFTAEAEIESWMAAVDYISGMRR
jgi:hypothetical protein